MKKFLILFIIFILSFSVKLKSVSATVCLEFSSKILKSYEVDLTGDGKTERVILSGFSLNGSPFYESIKITVSDDKTGSTLFSITPTTNFGYEPTIMVGGFTGDNSSEIFYGASSGKEGFGYYYLYSIEDGVKVLFDYESDVTSFNAVYENWYKVKVFDDNNYDYIDISNKKESLNSIYNNGILTKELKAGISQVYNASPCFDYSLNAYVLQVTRKITGLNSNDLLGFLIESYNYLEKDNAPKKTTFIAI